ncbi:MAG: hypothetical protein AAGE52_32810 [Myxococcota bacterium]
MALGLASALYLILAAAYSVRRVVAWMLPRASVWLRVSATMIFGTWCATIAFSLLFGAGLFHRGGALLLVTGAALAARQIPVGNSLWRRDFVDLGQSLRAFPWSPFHRVAVVFLVLRAARALLEPPTGWDWLTYHGTRAVLFTQQAGWSFPEAPGTWGLCRNYVAGSEVLSAWTLLPMRGFELAGLDSLAQWIAIGVLTVALARGLGTSLRGAIAASLALLFVPPLQQQVGAGYVDLALTMALLGTWVFALAWLNEPTKARLFLAACAGGLAIGIKLIGLLPVGVVGLVVVATALRSSAHRKAIPLAAPLALLLPGLPWFVVALRDTGLPLSPAPITVGGIALGEANAEMRRHLQMSVEGAYTWAGESAVLAKVFGPVLPPGQGLTALSAVPVLLTLAGAIRDLIARQWKSLLALAVLGSVLATYYHPGMSVFRVNWHVQTSRFLLPLMALALPLCVWCWDRRVLHLGLEALATLWALLYVAYGAAPQELIPIAAVTAVGVLALVAIGRSQPIAVALGLASLILGLCWAPTLRDAYFAEGFHLHHSEREWNEARRIVDSSRPQRVSVTAGTRRVPHHWFSTYLAGARLQNELVYTAITEDGTVFHPDVDGPPREGDRAAWVRRVERVDYVVTLPPRSVEQSWMDELPSVFEKQAGDERWGVYRLKARRPPRAPAPR